MKTYAANSIYFFEIFRWILAIEDNCELRQNTRKNLGQYDFL